MAAALEAAALFAAVAAAAMEFATSVASFWGRAVARVVRAARRRGVMRILDKEY